MGLRQRLPVGINRVGHKPLGLRPLIVIIAGISAILLALKVTIGVQLHPEIDLHRLLFGKGPFDFSGLDSEIKST